MNLVQWIDSQFLDENGDPLNGGKLYSYEAGTSTPLATYTDQGGGTPNANPIILDSEGRAEIWIDPATPYKFVLKDSSDVTILTRDNVGASSDVLGVDLEDNIELPGTEGFTPPTGTTAQRPSTPQNGETRYNTTLARLEVYENGWKTITTPGTIAGITENLGLSLATGTLSVTGADGTALSSSNSAFVTIQSPTSGQVVKVKVTSPASFQDAAHATDSDIIGEEFGVTTSVAWGDDRPFFLYFVYDGTDGYFAISPDPRASQSPATANCGYHDAPASTPSDSNFFFLTATDITSSHAQMPCVRVGGIRMQMDSSDDWTVQTLDYSKGDGIRPNPFEGKWFDMPGSQMGADGNGDFFSAASGSAPYHDTPANLVYKYNIDLNGKVTFTYNSNLAGNTNNGSAPSNVSLVLPYAIQSQPTGVNVWIYGGAWSINSKTPSSGGGYLNVISTNSDRQGIITATGDGITISSNEFASVNDDYQHTGEYNPWMFT